MSALTSDAKLEEKQKIVFQIYVMNGDGVISNGDLFNCLKMLVGDNLTGIQIQQLSDKTMIAADKGIDGKISYGEFWAFIKDIKIQDFFSMECSEKTQKKMTIKKNKKYFKLMYLDYNLDKKEQVLIV